jgi:hypothetical protein
MKHNRIDHIYGSFTKRGVRIPRIIYLGDVDEFQWPVRKGNPDRVPERRRAVRTILCP